MDLQHWARFREFVALETAVGGPDPHMRTAGQLVITRELRDRVWMAGCYVGVYNVPGAQLLFANWTAESAIEAGEPELAAWLREHWTAIPFRRERRAVRTPAKLARYLVSYAVWAADWPRYPEEISAEERYELAWRDVDAAVYGLGRYGLLKLLEFLRRYAGLNAELVGIRARGGWSPQEGLALLFPEVPYLKVRWQVAEDYAALVQLRLAEDGIELDWYRLQVFLCDYKQAWAGRQYPGRSLDSEIGYALHVERETGLRLNRFWDVRSALFPEAALGELHGWTGPREEQAGWLRATGVNWNPLA